MCDGELAGLRPSFNGDDGDKRTDVKVCEDSFSDGVDRARGCVRVMIPYRCLFI